MIQTKIVADQLSWDNTEQILQNIQPPIFADLTVSVVDFGADNQGELLATQAFQTAINYVNQQGGGTIIVPQGSYLIGSIELRSNVHLHLASERTLVKFTTEINEQNYPIVYGHWESTPIYNYRAFIYAFEAENIAITGKGTFDGQASDSVWWDWFHQNENAWSDSGQSLQRAASNTVQAMNHHGVPISQRIFGNGHYLRPNFIQLIKSHNVLLADFRLCNSPMWLINPVLCSNLIFRQLNLTSHGHNNDGIDPESCNYVLIEHNRFDVGDDCIAIKSGRDRDGRELNTACQNIIIRHNTFADGHGGIALGSEMSGGIKHVYANDNRFDSPNLTYPLRLKSNALRGGTIESIYFRNSTINKVNQATIHATMLYAEGRNGEYLPQFKDIIIENVTSYGGEYGIFLDAFKEVPITGLILKNITISGTRHAVKMLNVANDTHIENVVINRQLYPRVVVMNITGLAVTGNQLQVSSVIYGGEAGSVNYCWLLDNQVYSTNESISLTNDMVGKSLLVTATYHQQTTRSYPCKILPQELILAQASEQLNASYTNLVAKGIITDPTPFQLIDKPISRLTFAICLANLWHLTKPAAPINLLDICANTQDIDKVAAVIEQQMMALDHGYFYPHEPITKAVMATIIMMSCGMSYKNASSTYQSTYLDGEMIEDTHLTHVERAKYFGFLDADGDGHFHPSRVITCQEAIMILAKLTEFIGCQQ